MTRPRILFVYYTRDEWPLRAVLAAHFRAFRRHANADVVHLNAAFVYDAATITRLNFDAIIFHTTAVALRWYPCGLAPLEPLADAFADSPVKKIAMPQDDYMHSATLCTFFNRAKIDLVLSPVPPEARRLAYGSLGSARVEGMLTHYLDDRDIARARRFWKPLAARRVWVAYRAWKARAWVGRLGQLKIQVGEAARRSCADLGFLCDISVEPKDTIFGDDWLKFLAGSRATVGVEGGASIHDSDGRTFNAVEAYLVARPDASYEEISGAILKGQDDVVRFSALSPRHLEAIATRTAQILVEGEYSGVLQPERHYIPVRSDLSDMDRAIRRLSNTSAIEEMIERAYVDIALSGRYHWRTFIQDLISREIVARGQDWSMRERFIVLYLHARDQTQLLLVRVEAMWGRMSPFWRRAFAKLFSWARPLFRRPPGWRSGLDGPRGE